jgi:hypothetical protein
MWSSGQLQVHCQPLCGDIIGVIIRSLSWIGVSTLNQPKGLDMMESRLFPHIWMRWSCLHCTKTILTRPEQKDLSRTEMESRFAFLWPCQNFLPSWSKPMFSCELASYSKSLDKSNLKEEGMAIICFVGKVEHNTRWHYGLKPCVCTIGQVQVILFCSSHNNEDEYDGLGTWGV